MMMRLTLSAFFCASALFAAMALWPAAAQQAARFDDAGEAGAALERARTQAQRARQRVTQFQQQARNSAEASEKARAEAAALAAGVQQAEAAIGMAEAQLAIVNGQRRALDRQLADQREPIVRLTGALQTLVRRPAALGLMRPGSLRDTVYLSAVLDSTVPMVRQRTASLRAQLERARTLEGEARETLASRRESEERLASRRLALQAMAERERIVARRASGAADRESTRAIALAEQARDLDELVEQLADAGDLRARLAALPGPIPRPSDPGNARFADAAPPTPGPTQTAPPAAYRLPVDGRLGDGFGARSDAGSVQRGVTLLPRASAQVVAPGAGRIAFAGPYRGYGAIVIIEHENGWTSLVTGLDGLVTRTGQEVVAGSPLGQAGASSPAITLELRREGEAVNPLEFLG